MRVGKLSADLASQAAAGGKHAGHKRHVKRPCQKAPLEASDLSGEFVRHPAKRRHNRWTMPIKWDEVTEDVLGNTITVHHYDVKVEYSANDTDWFVHSRFKVPGKEDADDNNSVRAVVRGIGGQLAYRFSVNTIARRGTCESGWSDPFEVGSPTQGPPAPTNVSIHRRPHGIFVNWDEPTDTDDDDILDEDIDSYTAELFVGADTDYAFPDWLAFTAEADDDKLTSAGHGYEDGDLVQVRGGALPTGLEAGRRYRVRDKTTDDFKLAASVGGAAIDLTADGSGYVILGLYRKRRNLKKTQLRFHVDDTDLDEDQKFYSRVLSVSDERNKSAFIPATLGGNSDPDEPPDGRTPKNLRHVFTFTIPGSLEVKTYKPPVKADDDYRVRRVTGVAETAGAGGASKVDILVGASSMFNDDTDDMLTFSADDPDGSTKAMTIKDLARGDKLRVDCVQADGTPPQDMTIDIICDRMG